jgi:ATP-dependent Clp protease ATP-binding subunit ClpA/prophage maintenance system killer protein
MTPLDLPSLVVIASQTLGEDTQAVLGRLDVTAAQTALAEAIPDGDGNDPAASAAGLLSALIRHRPLVRGNEVVAVAAMTTFLAVNGWQADLDPAGAFPALLTGLASGQLPGADLTAWLSDHVFPSSGVPPGEAPTKEERMHGWLPGRRRPARKKGLFRRFTPEAREVVIGSQQEARRLRHNYIGTEHILLGLLRAGDGIAARALHTAGISREAARQQVLDIIGEGEQQPAGHIPFTPRAKKVLELALRESVSLGHMYIGSEHILLGLIREGSGLAAQILTSLGVSSSQLRDQVLELLSSERPAAAGPTVPPRIREFDKKIGRARQEKDAAIDARDFDRAAMLRDQEKELVAERDRQIELWSTGTDVAALGREVELLRAEVERLLEMLLQHGIDPSERGQQTA